MIVKICGVKREDTLIACEKEKVNFFGMIFYKSSPRNIEIENALYLQKISENLEINGVGVFVNENLSSINAILEILKLKYVQLHGFEDEDYIKSLKKRKIKIIKKISIKDKKDIDIVQKFNSADYFLFDYKPDKDELPGGNAKSFDWNILKNIKINKPWFISGGININNFNNMIDMIHPYGIDLSSGVEKEVGNKDNVMISKLMRNIRNA